MLGRAEARLVIYEHQVERADLARMWEWFDQVGYNVDINRLVRSYPEAGWHDFRTWARQQDWSVLAANAEQARL